MTSTHRTRSAEETMALGAEFSARLAAGSVVACTGPLGAGKTHFIKGICRGLGVAAHVASPTFTIINEYEAPERGVRICHVDCYRIASAPELRETGFEEYLGGDWICLIEWPERVEAILPARRFNVRLAAGSEENVREITIEEHEEVAA